MTSDKIAFCAKLLLFSLPTTTSYLCTCMNLFGTINIIAINEHAVLISDAKSYPKTGPQSSSESDEEILAASSTPDAGLDPSLGKYIIIASTIISSRNRGSAIISSLITLCICARGNQFCLCSRHEHKNRQISNRHWTECSVSRSPNSQNSWKTILCIT